jgi:hypothetical protein
VTNGFVSYTGNSVAHINDSPLSDTYVGEATDPLGLAAREAGRCLDSLIPSLCLWVSLVIPNSEIRLAGRPGIG